MTETHEAPVAATPDAAAESASSETLAAHRGQVEAMAGYGVPEAEIATVLDISPELLRLHFRRELDASRVKANARVAENLFRKATGDGREAVTAAIFWLKTRAGWKETSMHEVGGSAELPPLLCIQHVIIDPVHPNEDGGGDG